MVRLRKLLVYDVWERAHKGPKVEEKEWDFKIVPTKAAEIAKDLGIKVEKTMIIPPDDLADKVYEAGIRMLTEVGLYCIDTKRVVKVTEDEIRDGLKRAPRELFIGAGKDMTHMVQRRRGGDPIKPVIQGGPTGAPCSERWFLKIMQSYAQESVVDTLVNGVLSEVDGTPVTPGTPWEMRAVKLEQMFVRIAAANAGRPGMGV